MNSDGLLLVDKESGPTSHDIVDLFRYASRIKKVGHTGTLDPLATGLLVLCLGRATRLQGYLTKIDKTYEGTIQFGWATDTYDAAGAAVGEPLEVNVETIDFESARLQFVGELDQMPPAYSAKKIQGVRAYELARKGEVVPVTPKRVRIDEFTITRVEGSTLQFKVRCSAGTYLRSLAFDLGAAIGVPAHLKNLRRTAIGSLDVSQAVPSSLIAELTIEQILSAPQFQKMSEVNLGLESLLIDGIQERKLRQGQTIILKPSCELQLNQMVMLTSLHDELLAIGEVVEVLRADGGPVAVQPKLVL